VNALPARRYLLCIGRVTPSLHNTRGDNPVRAPVI